MESEQSPISENEPTLTAGQAKMKGAKKQSLKTSKCPTEIIKASSSLHSDDAELVPVIEDDSDGSNDDSDSDEDDDGEEDEDDEDDEDEDDEDDEDEDEMSTSTDCESDEMNASGPHALAASGGRHISHPGSKQPHSDVLSPHALKASAAETSSETKDDILVKNEKQDESPAGSPDAASPLVLFPGYEHCQNQDARFQKELTSGINDPDVDPEVGGFDPALPDMSEGDTGTVNTEDMRNSDSLLHSDDNMTDALSSDHRYGILQGLLYDTRRLSDPYQSADLSKESIKSFDDNASHTAPPKAIIKNSLECPICGKAMGSPGGLTFHIRNHSRVRPAEEREKKTYQCSVCNKLFIRSGDLTVHMRTHTGEKPYQCCVCSKAFIQSCQLNVHMRGHTGEKPFVCPICDKAFDRKESLTVHVRTHTGEKPFQCSVCGKTTSNSSALNRHLKTHSDERPYKCAVCDKSFARKQCFTEHMMRHSNSKPFKCDICGAGFAHSTALYKHRRRNICELTLLRGTVEKPFHCSACGVGFTLLKSLYKHQRKICKKSEFYDPLGLLGETAEAAAEERPFACPMCGVRFVALKSLHKHQREKCGKSDSSDPSLDPSGIPGDADTYMMQFPDGKPFECRLCGVRFTSKKSRHRHQKKKICEKYERHDAPSANVVKVSRDLDDSQLKRKRPQKRYHCSVCGVKFALLKSLYRHQRNRICEKVLQSEQNEKGLSGTLGDIDAATIMLDPDKKPYECPICGARFALFRSLHRHQKKNVCERLPQSEPSSVGSPEISEDAYEKPFQCTVCGVKFSHSKSLYKHQRNKTCEKSNLYNQFSLALPAAPEDTDRDIEEMAEDNDLSSSESE